MAEADPMPPVAEAEVRLAQKSRRRWPRLALMLSLPLLLAAGALLYWQSLAGKVSTDNAYLKQDKVSISAEVGGRIVEVFVRENQSVEAGTLLFRIDPEPYRLQIAQADAAIAGAQANVTSLANASELTGAEISAAREDIAFAEANFRRKDELFRRGFLTRTEHDAASHAVAQAREALRLAEARQAEARARLATGAQVPGQNPQVAAARAERASASLALSRTEVRAPVGGRVAQADRLHVGQQLVAGLPAVTLVAVSAYRDENPALPHALWAVVPLTASCCLARLALRLTRHAYLILTPLGIDIFPFFRPADGMRTVFWHEIHSCEASGSMLTLHFNSEMTSGIHVSLLPLVSSGRSLLIHAVKARVGAGATEKD